MNPMKICDKSPANRSRIILFGSEGGFSLPVLKRLLACNLCVGAVVMLETAPNKCAFPVNIKQTGRSGGLEDMAVKNQLDILKTQNLNDERFINQLKEKQADVLLVACFAQKIPARIWQKMNLPCWNLHPSLLPKYRGPTPLYWQIKQKETETGLTLHEVNGRFDAGNIVAQAPIPLPAKQDKQSLHHWVAEHGVELLNQALLKMLNGQLNPKSQNEALACYFPYPP